MHMSYVPTLNKKSTKLLKQLIGPWRHFLCICRKAIPVSKPISNHHRSDIVQISARYRKRHRTAYRFAHRLKVGPISWRLHIGPISGGYRFSHRTDILPSLDRYWVYRLDILYDIGPISFCPLASSRTDIDLYVFHSLLLQDHLGGFHLNGFTHKHG